MTLRWGDRGFWRCKFWRKNMLTHFISMYTCVHVNSIIKEKYNSRSFFPFFNSFNFLKFEIWWRGMQDPSSLPTSHNVIMLNNIFDCETFLLRSFKHPDKNTNFLCILLFRWITLPPFTASYLEFTSISETFLLITTFHVIITNHWQ